MNTPVEEIRVIRKKLGQIVIELAKVEAAVEALGMYIEMTEGGKHESQ